MATLPHVSFPLKTSAIMLLHNFLSFGALSKLCLSSISVNPSSDKDFHRLFRKNTRCFPLSLLPIMCPVSDKAFFTCHWNFIFLFLSFFVFIFSKVSSFLTVSVHLYFEPQFCCFKSTSSSVIWLPRFTAM